MCDSQTVEAVVDTGAAVTVISPRLLEKTTFKLHGWKGAKVLMANGTKATPIGGANIIIRHERGKAQGEALMLDMDSINLLLGNDFLKQFGKLQID